jgi:mannose-6-phosphate isomerase
MATDKSLKQPLILEPQYRDYVWGGHKLRPNVPGPTAEAWAIYEEDRIAQGPAAGQTLGEVAKEYGKVLLGKRVAARGLRFPLLIKLLDCADWLSIQVHPNDEQARRLEGPDQNGKTEAWYVIEADPGATLLCGIKSGTPKQVIERDVRNGTILDIVQKFEMHTGDSILIQAGMVHALGPGLMVYEVQQTSDITYRVFDWNRPASEGRPLHIEKSLQVIRPDLEPVVIPPLDLGDGEKATLVHSQYFRLELLAAQTRRIEMDTEGETFHALTVLSGRAILEGPDWQVILNRWQSAVVPADCEKYRILPEGNLKMLRSAVD